MKNRNRFKQLTLLCIVFIVVSEIFSYVTVPYVYAEGMNLTYDMSSDKTSGNGIPEVTVSESDIKVEAERALKKQEWKAECGDKLVEINLPEGVSFNGILFTFEYVALDNKPVDGETLLIYDGKKKTVGIKYSAVYGGIVSGNGVSDNEITTSEILYSGEILVECMVEAHNIKNESHFIKTDAQKPTESGAGCIEYYKCKSCGKLFDKDGNNLTDNECIVPFFKRDAELTVGKTIKLNSIMINGIETYRKMTVDKASEKYVTVNAEKKTITAKKIKSSKYKNLPKSVNVIIEYSGGRKETVKINLTIPELKLKVGKKKEVFGVKEKVAGYKYTLKYSAKGASKVSIKGTEGLDKDMLKKLNRLLTSKMKKGKSGKISFTITKRAMLSEKITFNITAKYGKRAFNKAVTK